MTSFSIYSREIDFYDPETKRHIATYKFIKSKSRYLVKYVNNYPHDDVYVQDIVKFKRDKGYMTHDELAML